MPFLGVLVTEGRAGRGLPKAALPLVVRARPGGRIVGVVVVDDPSWRGPPLDGHLALAGHGEGPFDHVAPGTLDRAGKTACARAIAAHGDPALDKVGALAAFGFRMEMLA